MKIRPATPADVPFMLALEKHAVTASHWSPQHYEAIFAAADQGRLGFVLEEESGLQAFLIARVVRNEWEIENIAVAGPARRRGLGTRLLGEFLDHVKANAGERVFLEVRESNRAARSLYEKWAFLEAGRRKKYYRDPSEDAVIYQLEL
ncbi:MAG TPA: ribosomal protein S18-alanine N-acetyltransferase [Terriglobales bacterium]|nr:ribosomal protein S18-alanine N-acetyltransferase [Terriglobales bacterium]